MAVPLSYVVRNLAARKVTTALTAGGLALVVCVATVLMLDEGLRKTLVDTGSWDTVWSSAGGRDRSPKRAWTGSRPRWWKASRKWAGRARHALVSRRPWS